LLSPCHGFDCMRCNLAIANRGLRSVLKAHRAVLCPLSRTCWKRSEGPWRMRLPSSGGPPLAKYWGGILILKRVLKLAICETSRSLTDLIDLSISSTSTQPQPMRNSAQEWDSDVIPFFPSYLLRLLVFSSLLLSPYQKRSRNNNPSRNSSVLDPRVRIANLKVRQVQARLFSFLRIVMSEPNSRNV
jgi:hypothetical protein